MKHEFDFIIRHNEFLAEHVIKNEVGQLLCKYKHGNDIHEHWKLQKFVLNLLERSLRFNKFKQICHTSKLYLFINFVYLLQRQKYKTKVQKQKTQNNSSNIEW